MLDIRALCTHEQAATCNASASGPHATRGYDYMRGLPAYADDIDTAKYSRGRDHGRRSALEDTVAYHRTRDEKYGSQGSLFEAPVDGGGYGQTAYATGAPLSASTASSPLVPVTQGRSASDSEDEDDQEDNTDRKAPVLDNTAVPIVYEFACPFYKRNRGRYCQQRSCRTSGWPSVHRVKEHLYRHHIHHVCDRCSSTFKVQSQLRAHLRQEVACPVSPRSVAEDAGFDLEMEKKLRSRKKIEGQTESDKWRHMFRMLFPSFKDRPTPSPYIDYSIRDEPLMPIIKDESPGAHAMLLGVPALSYPESDHSNLMTIATVAAAAADQHTDGPASNNMAADGMHIDQQPATAMACSTMSIYQSPVASDDIQFVSRSAVYKMVQEQVFTILKSMPANSTFPSPNNE